VQVTPQKPDASSNFRVRWAAKDLLLADAERYRIGVTLSEADDTLRTQLRLAAGEGLVVTDVVPDSAATAAGIQVNDVLTVLDGKRLTTVEAINAQVQEIKDRLVELRLAARRWRCKSRRGKRRRRPSLIVQCGFGT
jgi:S1-C subfamily serine protease